MYSYEEMPANSRVWIYQCDREFNERETNEIDFLGEHFADTWASHGNDLKAFVKVYYNRFIVVMVDELQAAASGCSIDKSVAFIKSLEGRYGVNLLNRMVMAYWNEDKKVTTCNLNELTKLLEHSFITEDSTIFNNLVKDKAEFETKWQVPLRDSWVLQYAN